MGCNATTSSEHEDSTKELDVPSVKEMGQEGSVILENISPPSKMIKLNRQELRRSGPINDAYTGASIGNSGSLSTEFIDHCLGNPNFASLFRILTARMRG